MAARRPAAVVAGLGAAQLIAWGTLYYGIAVLGEPMSTDLGLTRGHVFGAFAWSMVVSGVLAPWAGRTLDRLGGRAVLASSALLGAAGFVTLARVHSLSGLLLGWSIQGLAMALGLYDTCFAAIGRVLPGGYRRTVTGVTLIAGFASTVSWPATHHLVRCLGWRASCDVYAAAMLACATLYASVLPAVHPAAKPHPPDEAEVGVEISAAVRKRAQLLAWAFAGAAVVGASLSAHLLGVLEALQLPSDQVVWIGASIGVMQVAGRGLELAFGARLHPVRLGFVSFAGLAAAPLLLVAAGSLPPVVYAFALTYGVTNGLLTIAKATLPVEMFGLANLGAVLGSFSAPSLVARALAPFAFAVVWGAIGAVRGVVTLSTVSLVSCALYVAATRTDAMIVEPPRCRRRQFRKHRFVLLLASPAAWPFLIWTRTRRMKGRRSCRGCSEPSNRMRRSGRS